MRIINFDVRQFNNLKNDQWMLGNNILYKMCLDYPLHNNPEEICAKIWLIGRSYAASIERRTIKKHINDDFYDYVVQEFIKFNHRNNFDKKLKIIKADGFNKQNLERILSLHKELTMFFKKLTGKEKRSLASKYLHFHCQLFPIYDSRAKNSINSIVKGKVEHTKGDEEYENFCNKMLFFYNFIKKETGKTPSLRQIDNYLVVVANNKLNHKYKN